MELEELIARLEAATGPDREMDAAIMTREWKTQPLKWENHNGWDTDGTPFPDDYMKWFDGERWRHTCVDFYTSSLDAALTLVPEGSSVHLHIMPREIGHKAEVGIGHASISKANPAIALTAAALKAKSHHHKAGEEK